MSQDELTQIANHDTPEGVTVPNNPYSLAVWAMGRFGVGIAIAAVFGVGIKEVYRDMREQNAQLLAAYRDNTRVIAEFAKAIDAQTKAIDAAHQRSLTR